MKDHDKESLIGRALLEWLYEAAAFGVLVTGADLKILYTNDWFRKSLGPTDPPLEGRALFDAFPELPGRGFDRFYNEALAGQSRVLSHRFHKFLIPMAPIGKKGAFDNMQQSARISPLVSEDQVLGTISVIEDVTERVSLEMELNFRITETQRLLESEISARELAEENNRIRDSFEALQSEGNELKELSRARSVLMHRVLNAQEEERRRVAREIHDNLGQQLTALSFAISRLRTAGTNGETAEQDIEIAERIAKQLDSEVDFLARRVRPAQIDDLGLEEALRSFIEEWSEHVGIAASFYSFGLEGMRLGADIEINLYRIAQEALNNISKHAEASRVSVLLENRENGVVLIVEDDGVGFEPAKAEGSESRAEGLGLFGMKERSTLIGGTFEIESELSRGTTVFVRVGLPAPEAAREAGR